LSERWYDICRKAIVIDGGLKSYEGMVWHDKRRVTYGLSFSSTH
jgi:hypothetical protein